MRGGGGRRVVRKRKQINKHMYYLDESNCGRGQQVISIRRVGLVLVCEQEQGKPEPQRGRNCRDYYIAAYMVSIKLLIQKLILASEDLPVARAARVGGKRGF